MTAITPFLMFEGGAALAMELYTSAFMDGTILSDDRYHTGPMEGRVRLARIRIAGQEFLLSDSGIEHDFGFTPASSIHVELESEDDLYRLHDLLGRNGRDLMKPDDYGFSQMFCWFNDRLGVSWQLNVPRVGEG